MIHKYSEYLNLISEAYTGSNPNPSSIYWKSELEDVINNDWTQISVDRYNNSDMKGTGYLIKFRTGDEKYDYKSVIVEKKGTTDFYYLEDGLDKIFCEKFKTEFWKAAQEYHKNMKYMPKCLGETEFLKDADKYNI